MDGELTAPPTVHGEPLLTTEEGAPPQRRGSAPKHYVFPLLCVYLGFFAEGRIGRPSALAIFPRFSQRGGKTSSLAIIPSFTQSRQRGGFIDCLGNPLVSEAITKEKTP